MAPITCYRGAAGTRGCSKGLLSLCDPGKLSGQCGLWFASPSQNALTPGHHRRWSLPEGEGESDTIRQGQGFVNSQRLRTLLKQHPNHPPTEPATHVRFGVLAFACALAMIVYLDRTCIASAAPSIARTLGLNSTADLGPIYAAFALAYALFEVPNGWLGDVFGPRKVLIRIACWWSVFLALSGAVGLSAGGLVLGGFWTLVAVQFLAGAGEAGAFPNITRSLHNWFPYQERGIAQGTVWMCGRLMGGLTPLIWMLLVGAIGYVSRTLTGSDESALPAISPWRAAIWTFGLLGVTWSVLFALWFRNRPEEHPRVNAAELAKIRSGGTESTAAHAGVPWGRILKSSNLWVLCLMYACQSYGWYFYITYLPQFREVVEQRHHLPTSTIFGALCKGGPLWMGAIGCLVGGFLTDWYIRKTGNLRWGRRIFGAAGHAATATCFLLSFLTCSLGWDPFWIFPIIALAGFCTDLTMGPAWALCQDIGKRYAAIVAGFMNMIGNLGGTLASLVSGMVLRHTLHAHALRLGIDERHLNEAQTSDGLWPGYQIIFLIAIGMYVVGVICWLRVDATRPVVPEDEARSA